MVALGISMALSHPQIIDKGDEDVMREGKEYLVRAIRESTRKTISEAEALKIVNLVSQYSSYWEKRCENEGLIPKEIYYGIIHHESRFRARATSYFPAYGLMQLTPIWRGKAPKYNVDEDMYDVAKNICAGIYVFNHYVRLARHKNVDDILSSALAYYNAGYRGANLGRGKVYAEEVMSISKKYRTI